jgi:hypothetical protein
MARAMALLVLVFPTPPLPPTNVMLVGVEDVRGRRTSSKALVVAKVDTLELLGMLRRPTDQPLSRDRKKGNFAKDVIKALPFDAFVKKAIVLDDIKDKTRQYIRYFIA